MSLPSSCPDCEMLPSLEAYLAELKKIKGPTVVLGHLRPDPDCIGAAIGLCGLLRGFGVEAYAMTPDPIPLYSKFMVAGADFLDFSRDFLKGRTLLSVDCATRGLLEKDGPPLQIELALDHHLSHSPYAKKYYVEPLPSASQMVTMLYRLAGVKPTVVASRAMYAGMSSDTGRWWWGGVSAESFECGAWLVGHGADPMEIGGALSGSMRWEHLALLQRALGKMEKLFDGKVLLLTLEEADFAAVGATRYDKDGISDFLRNLEGVEIVALVNMEKGVCKAQLRAKKPSARVDKFCEAFGGGGHAAAAGIAMGVKEPLELFLPRFRSALEAHYRLVAPALEGGK